jgi:FkbM family methyltransferase
MKGYIFDLGFHNGDDTDYYLKKEYNVIAVEGNPELVAAGALRFSTEIKDGKLVLLNKVVSDITKETDFYIHPTRYDWSSCERQKVEWDGSTAKKVSIKTITLEELYKYGDPYYIKTDLEGNDVILAKQLAHSVQKPKYVSFEISKTDYYHIFNYLYIAGYNLFQLVNQANNPEKIDKDISYKFTKYSSGLFGEDLPQARWLSFDTALTNYMKYKDLKIIDNQELALGWIDLHATVI